MGHRIDATTVSVTTVCVRNMAAPVPDEGKPAQVVREHPDSMGATDSYRPGHRQQSDLNSRHPIISEPGVLGSGKDRTEQSMKTLKRRTVAACLAALPDRQNDGCDGALGPRLRANPMRLLLTIVGAILVLFVAGTAGVAVADPINSPRVSGTGTLVCGDVTYTNVSPPGPTPAGQMVTANGSDSTSVQIMILDKATAFPQDLLTDCMFTSPEQFQVQLLITPVR
jgi:hypothetical protein